MGLRSETSPTNGRGAVAQDQLIRTICETSAVQLFVATILPQKAGGKRITLVDMHGAFTAKHVLPDGAYPGHEGMEKMAETWSSVL